LATLHHQLLHIAHPYRRTTRTTLAAGLLAGVLLVTPTAHAAPRDGAAKAAHVEAVAQVAAIQARVSEAEDNLQRMTVEAEAASGAALAAQAELAAAQAQATATASELAAVRGEVDRTQDDVADLGREAYMGSSEEGFGDVAVLLDADSPTEVLQQAATLEVLGEERTEQLAELEDVEAQEARVDRAARTAVAERDAIARTAEETAAAAETQLAAAQGSYDALAAEKSALDAQLREAEIRLL
jgi:chromosome segregation ATPase